MNDARADVHLLAGLLADLDRVLNPLPPDGSSDYTVEPPIPPPLPSAVPGGAGEPDGSSGRSASPALARSGSLATPFASQRTPRAAQNAAPLDPALPRSAPAAAVTAPPRAARAVSPGPEPRARPAPRPLDTSAPSLPVQRPAPAPPRLPAPRSKAPSPPVEGSPLVLPRAPATATQEHIDAPPTPALEHALQSASRATRDVDIATTSAPPVDVAAPPAPAPIVPPRLPRPRKPRPQQRPATPLDTSAARRAPPRARPPRWARPDIAAPPAPPNAPSVARPAGRADIISPATPALRIQRPARPPAGWFTTDPPRLPPELPSPRRAPPAPAGTNQKRQQPPSSSPDPVTNPDIDSDLTDVFAVDESDDLWETPQPDARRRWVTVGNRLVEISDAGGSTRDRRDRALGRRFQDRARWRLR